jgi:putative protease
MRPLELLAPAKNLECGIAAIDHGADAVYIGAQRFGARAAAGNTVEDIRQLCQYAHPFGAKVYVTVNTIVFDGELDDTCQLIRELADAGVDALLVQDMGVVQLSRKLLSDVRIPLHASTQTDNRSAEKVEWLSDQGFKRVVLARELSVDEIAAIHRAVPDMELEVFVHGALCVSYSGLCYASQYCFGRSANRGECAQFCRMKFSLLDADGKVLEHERYLLSLKDMCQIDHLEELADAGAASFKIEGRLKDVGYVKNVVAAYSERLNEIVKRRPKEFCRSSRGKVKLFFQPDLNKTYNRGYTTYFLHGRQPGIASFDTPKAIGEFVGVVKEIRGGSFNVAGTARFANGDGLCFLNQERQLEGFRVNRVENNRIFPLRMPSALRPGMRLYRNNDQEFERLLSRTSAERKIPVVITIRPSDNGFLLTFDGVELNYPCEHQMAKSPQHENIRRQLSRLGGTPFECAEVIIPADFPFFIPSSQLAEMRRMAVQETMARQHSIPCKQINTRCDFACEEVTSHRDIACENLVSGAKRTTPPQYPLSYLYNVANHEAIQFYKERGVHPSSAFERQLPVQTESLLMQCRHCLRYSLGFCVKHGGKKPVWREPLRLQLGDGRQFHLVFDCSRCQMNIFPA